MAGSSWRSICVGQCERRTNCHILLAPNTASRRHYDQQRATTFLQGIMSSSRGRGNGPFACLVQRPALFRSSNRICLKHAPPMFARGRPLRRRWAKNTHGCVNPHPSHLDPIWATAWRRGGWEHAMLRKATRVLCQSWKE